MSQRGRAKLNQYSKGVSHSSRLSRTVNDFSQASALNDTLHIQQAHSIDNYTCSKNTSEASQYIVERYGMSWADSEGKMRRLLATLVTRSQSSHEGLLELDSKLKMLANKVNSYASSSTNQLDTSKRACLLLEQVIEMKANFYERLDSALNQLRELSIAHSSTLQALDAEKQRVEVLTKEADQLRVDYSTCRDANAAQAASLTDTQMQLLETSSFLENAKKNITVLSDENAQLRDSLQLTSHELMRIKAVHCNQNESFEALLERSSAREQTLLRELDELQLAYAKEKDLHATRTERIHHLSSEISSLQKQVSKQRRRARIYKLKTGQLRRTAKELKVMVRKNTAMGTHDNELLTQKDAQIVAIVKKLEEYKARAKKVSSYECKLASQRGEIEKLSTYVAALEQDLDRYKAKRLKLSAPTKVITASKDGKSVQLSVSDDGPRSEGLFASTRNYCAVL
ncbi:Hypothetical protein GLP15_4237 [Giardia lamblia P15]|uniref:Uncharacterized protein n=1 Tax=Giardia intestinalis (strain P15) TaxID=658858 RepID=E1EY33_GIAIA|nr:Hypothetical protein GLP15_4237 [Giardia lamblia P15]